MFSDVGMNDAVFEILDVDHRRLVRFLPTDQEDIWPDWRDRNLNGLRGPLEGALGGRERHHRLRCEVEMVDPTPEICFIHVADSWKVGSGHGLLLFAPPFENVQKLLLLWRSQRDAPTLRGYPHPLMFCMSTMYHFGANFTSGSGVEEQFFERLDEVLRIIIRAK